MDITLTEHTIRIVVAELRDRADSYNITPIRNQLYEIIAGGVSRIVIDLTNVTFMDSSCMAILVSTLKRTRQAGGDVKLVWPQLENAQDIIRLAKFDRVFEIFNTSEEAVEGFFSPSEVPFTDPFNIRRPPTQAKT